MCVDTACEKDKYDSFCHLRSYIFIFRSLYICVSILNYNLGHLLAKVVCLDLLGLIISFMDFQSLVRKTDMYVTVLHCCSSE